MASYLDQLEVSARPSTVAAAELTLRLFAHRVTEADPSCTSVARIGRAHIEDFKSWLAARRGRTGKPLATITIRHRLSTVRTFFERIMEWDYDDAPARLFIYMSDFPALDEPLPKFLDDPTAAKFMAALAQDPNLRRRLMVELLARTGMRVGELSGLEDDAMVRKGDGHRLRIPIGKLHNDRYVPLLPMLVDLIVEYRAVRGRSRSGHLLERDDGQPFDRRTIHRYVASVAKRAGVGHVHPHQLRHTLATQSINRGMSLEAIAALLGHRSMDMTLTYARISDRDGRRRVLQGDRSGRGPVLRTLRRTPLRAANSSAEPPVSDHRRLLANGHCTRPALLDCAFESVCERCGFFETGPQFLTILKRQRKHADERGQSDRVSSSTASSKESPMPSECASIGESPGPTDHLYNAGYVTSQVLTYDRVPH